MEEDEQESSVKEQEEENLVTENYTFVIAEIRYVEIDGNTWVYLLAEDGALYKAKFADNEGLIYLNAGDEVSADCVKGKETALEMKSFQVK